MKSRAMKPLNMMLVTGLTCLLLAPLVFGLGLGEIKQNSALNEPLDAEVELLGLGDLGELELLVGLGSRGDFARAGVDREFFLTELRFKVDLSDAERPLIRITSGKPVKEPYLDFLMDVQWPSGHLLREYTLLLDLPLFTEAPEAKSVEAASTRPQPQQKSQPKTEQSPSTASTMSTSSDYKVRSGDTLWGIAKRIRPEEATLHQTMAAIQQRNPKAFINGDPNLLKSGYVLRLPENSDITGIDRAEAIDQITSNVAPSAPVVTEDVEPTSIPLDASAEIEITAPIEQPVEGRLKLAVSQETAETATVESSNAAGGDAESQGFADQSSVNDIIQNDFSLVQEELDKASRENSELRERMENLEQQIETMRRMMELNDPTLAALQNSAAAESEAIADTSTGNEEKTISVTEETATVTSTASEPQWQRWLDMLLYPIIGLLVLLLLVFLLFRNRSDDDDTDDSLQGQPLYGVAPADEETSDDAELLTKEELVIAEDMGETITEDDLAGLELNDDEGVDTEGEADIYLSLGNYGHAESVLQEALELQPENSALHLKLLEVYVAMNALDKFDNQAQRLNALDDTDASDRARRLRRELVDGEASEATPEEVAEPVENETVSDEADFDLELELNDLDTDSPADNDTDKVDTASDLDFDFESVVKPLEEIALEDASSEAAEEMLADIDADLDMLPETDECATKLGLAEAFLEMGDRDGAKEILDEVLSEGSDEQKDKARLLLESIS